MPIYKIPGQKKDGLQKYRVVVNWTDADGRKRTKEKLVSGKAQAEAAEEELRKIIRDEPEPKKKAAAEMTVQKLYDLYVARRKGELRQATLEKKQSVLKTHVLPLLKETPLRELDGDALRTWRTKIGEKPLLASTKNTAYKELRTMLIFARDYGLLKESPMKEIKPFRDPYREAAAVKLRYYTKPEFDKFIAEAKSDAEKIGALRVWGLYVFFMMAYYTGMRKGEINALRWTDVDGERYIWVRRSMTQKVKGEKWIETPPKTESSVRRIQMPLPLIAALKEHKERQKKMDGWNESLFICGGFYPMPDTVIENANKLYGERAGLPHITIHEFRHSHASLLCNAGVNIKEIARRLGHTDVEITLKTYSHLYPTEEERAVAVLNNL